VTLFIAGDGEEDDYDEMGFDATASRFMHDNTLILMIQQPPLFTMGMIFSHAD